MGALPALAGLSRQDLGVPSSLHDEEDGVEDLEDSSCRNAFAMARHAKWQCSPPKFEISPAIYRVQNPENPKSLKKVSREEFGTP